MKVAFAALAPAAFRGGGRTGIQVQSAAGSWSCTASVVDGSPSVTISHLVDGETGRDEGSLIRLKAKPYDMRLQRDWMEFVDASGVAGDVSDGSSAYDVLRCDLVCKSGGDVATGSAGVSGDDDSRWKIWGESFHLKRLRSSYRDLVRSGDGKEGVDVADEEEALRESAALIRAILFEAHKSKHLLSVRKGEAMLKVADEEDVFAQLVRVSLMWTPTRSSRMEEGLSESDAKDVVSTKPRIVVRGHASSNGDVFPPHRRPVPITVSMAVKSDVPCDGNDPLQKLNGGASLPNRQGSPQLKISSWSRLRRPLETKRFKPPGVSEVLMVKQAEGGAGMEILEGLTSNFFAIYKDGTIRTAQEGILHGYARHLVLECAGQCGLSFDPSPVLMRDAVEGRWAEAFITSSSRLIFPIERIVAPEYSRCNISDEERDEQGTLGGDDDLTESEISRFKGFWSLPQIDGSSLPWKTPRWEAIYDLMLREGGYD